MKKKLLPLLIAVLLLWVGIYYAATKILASYALCFRTWIDVVFWIVTVLLSAAILIIGIYKLGKFGGDRSARVGLRITAWVGAVALTAALLFGGYLVLLSIAIGNRPEHVVDRDGRQIVAVVHGFLDVNVYYYDYVNVFVRGSQWQISEWYGNGAYDPFDREVMPTPLRTDYYTDMAGNG